ncbi:hypothetical protein, variant [Cryptococcus amylolentus CBS 6039]|uniref:RTA1 like protein n=1 Tax=Cryptococcus amylolentus CBS 6039 TaxID=1295533 RepID=A0A1E3HTL1_9TREE|nr:hypothetical protein, variant [Cryptococcus amylolentus CBS 6039]ODN78791.1 hypothetical protein, variant [Cryptococcus amylolentus CBS 6039]
MAGIVFIALCFIIHQRHRAAPYICSRMHKMPKLPILTSSTTMSDDTADASAYGYTPTAWVALTFICLFSVSDVVHLAQGCFYKYYLVFPTLVIGCTLEIIGWAARYWSSQNVLARDPFLMQIITLIFAPVFFSAYCYTILGVAITALGPQYSLLSPKWYVAVFVSCDVVSLILQAVGGGWAASTDVSPIPHTPTNIMVGGIIFQLVTMIIFSYLAADFMWRAHTKKPFKRRAAAIQQQEIELTDAETAQKGSLRDSRASSVEDIAVRQREMRGWWFVMLGVAICSVCIILRGFYRSVELVQGWDGYLIEHEVYQDVLDGIPMFIAIASVNIFHPGFFLPRRQGWKNP